jgi:hypothetical protein
MLRWREVRSLKTEQISDDAFYEQSAHAAQSSLDRLLSSIIVGAFDTRQECRKIDTKMAMHALLSVEFLADNKEPDRFSHRKLQTGPWKP